MAIQKAAYAFIIVSLLSSWFDCFHRPYPPALADKHLYSKVLRTGIQPNTRKTALRR